MPNSISNLNRIFQDFKTNVLQQKNCKQASISIKTNIFFQQTKKIPAWKYWKDTKLPFAISVIKYWHFPSIFIINCFLNFKLHSRRAWYTQNEWENWIAAETARRKNVSRLIYKISHSDVQYTYTHFLWSSLWVI